MRLTIAVFAILTFVALTGCGGGEGGTAAPTYCLTAEYHAPDGEWYNAPSEGDGVFGGPVGWWRFRVWEVAPSTGEKTLLLITSSVYVIGPDGSDGDPLLPSGGEWYVAERNNIHVIATVPGGSKLEMRIAITS